MALLGSEPEPCGSETCPLISGDESCVILDQSDQRFVCVGAARRWPGVRQPVDQLMTRK